jgi:hypothetical protein
VTNESVTWPSEVRTYEFPVPWSLAEAFKPFSDMICSDTQWANATLEKILALGQ